MKRKLISLGLAAAMAVSLAACSGPQLTEITLPAEPLELATGETATLETGFVYDGETPENAQVEVTYSSDDEAVATVSEDGTVTAVAEGDATITATAGEFTATQGVVVTVPVESLTVSDLTMHIDDGAVAVAYTVVPENFSGELTMTIADESIATVSADGMVAPVAEGETTLTIMAPNGKTASAAVSVWSGPKSLSLAAGKTEVTTGSGTQISVTDDQGNVVDTESLLWASGDESIAVVTNGWVDVVGTGDVTITASNNYGISASVELTGVAPAPKPAATTGGAAGGSSAAGAAGGSGSSAGGAASVGGGSAPAANSGHGYFTVYGDGTAFDLQNQVRAEAGVGALVWDNGLGDIAAARCEEIAVDFSHNGMRTAGENIAMGPGDSSSAIAAWQASPGHYSNMVNSGFTSGAIVHMYDGDGCHYWVAVFQ